MLVRRLLNQKVLLFWLWQELHGRDVTVIRHKGKLYALDALCYHLGGPLGEEGDIEDISSGQGNNACITCPWHHHKVCLVMFYTARCCCTLTAPVGKTSA